MKEFKNEAQVRRYLLPKLRKVIEYVLNEIKQYNEDLIYGIVYAKYNPEEYERTYEFVDAWKVDKIPPPHGIHVKGEFKYDPSAMSYNPDLAQHGSPIEGWGSAVDYMADLIYNGRSGPLFGEGFWTQKRDVWSELYDRLGEGKLEQFFKEGLEREGLNVQFHW